MNKKLFSILSTLFLVGILFVSCSNKDKTGSDSSSNSNGKVDTIYAGDWYEKSDQSYTDIVMSISADGSISVPNIEKQNHPSKKVEGSGNSYTITYGEGATAVIFKITFTDADNGQVTVTAGGTPAPSTLEVVKRK